MTEQRIELPVDYYLHNFERLVDATERYSDILPIKEASALSAYQQLSSPARMLLVRLLSRKGIYFRQSKLHYAEIGPLDSCILELIESELVVHESPSPEEFFKLITLKELRQLLNNHPLNDNKFTKQQLVEQLLKREDVGGVVTRFDVDFTEQWLKIECQPLLDLLLLLYFGNAYQDLSQFVLSDLGLQRFEAYQIRYVDRAYNNAEELQHALDMAQLTRRWHEQSENKQPIDIDEYLSRLPVALTNPLLQRRRDKLLYHIGRQAERVQRFTTAEACYQQCQTWVAKERLCRIYEKLNPVAAVSLLCELSEHAPNEACSLIVKRIAQRVVRKINPTSAFIAVNRLAQLISEFEVLTEPMSQSISLPYDPSISVEQAVVQYYRQQNDEAFFCGNSLLCGLFGLAFWDIIFAPILGAFDNPFQRAPRDMYHESFVSSRQDGLDKRLIDISNGDYRMIRQHFIEKQGLTNEWVDWPIVSEQLLELALTHFSSHFLTVVFKRMLKDPKHYRSGQPDVVVFSKNSSPQFIEVKGPGDTLADHQGYWLSFLAKYYPASVCYVQWVHQP